jgi:phosphate:Na+ symporter
MSATDVLIHLLGAAALLVWGTRMVRTGVMRAFGADLRHVLRVSLHNRFTALAAGLAVTAVLQSSTATALIVASFAGRGVVGTAPALAVMLGADVGTTLVAQVLSLDIRFLSPILILAGVVTHLTVASAPWRDLGRVGIGLGLMLLSLRLILATSEPLHASATLQDVLGALAGERLIGLLITALLAWIAHSSLAVVLLVMALTASGVVPMALALALVLGANLGGAIPPLVATAGDDPRARRVPLGNLLVRLTGCLVALPLLDLVPPWLAMLEDAPARMVVNFHTGFNLVLALSFIMLTEPIAALCTRILPERLAPDDPGRPRYLDRSTLDSPALALASAAREALRMGDVVESMLREAFEVLRTDDRERLKRLAAQDDVVDRLHEEIKLFVTEASREPMSPAETRRAAEILNFATNLEHIGDIVDKSFLELVDKKIKKKLRFSREGLGEIQALHGHILHDMQLALGVFVSGDVAIARQLILEKVAVREAERQAAENHLERLRAGRVESIDSSALHLDVLRDLKRIHSHICAIAYPLLDEAGQLHRSRLKRAEREAFGDEPAPERPPPAPRETGAAS